jgi:hypothetical protein
VALARPRLSVIRQMANLHRRRQSSGEMGGDDLSTTNKMFHKISMDTFVRPFGAFDAARF